MPQSSDDARELNKLVEILTQMGLDYALGGSMASSVHGVPRFTRDSDVTVEPFPGREREFASCFGPDYYLSETAIREANRSRRSFNIINTLSGFKFDIFVRSERPFEVSAMGRRIIADLGGDPPIRVAIYSAEDIVLFKLDWYRLGDETSERQWSDILGVVQTQGERLDRDYLRHWATQLAVDDLLRRALGEPAA